MQSSSGSGGSPRLLPYYAPMLAHQIEYYSNPLSESSTISRLTENAGFPKKLQKKLIQ